MWNTVNVVAVATTIWLIARCQHPSGDRTKAWRIFIGAFALMAYANTSLWVFQPASGHMIEAYIGLTVATGYVLMGLWLGLRYVIAGVVCAALLIGGYIFLRENYSVWMGVVAGGTMILCGVWMRRA